MLISINGRQSEAAEQVTLHELLAGRGMNEKAVILELNGQIVKRENWGEIRLNHNDQLEIIRIIGGG